MSQVSLYMNEGTMNLLRTQSNNEGISISRYVANIVESHVSGNESAWPKGYWESVYGCLTNEEASCLNNIAYDSCLNDGLDDDCRWFEESGDSHVLS